MSEEKTALTPIQKLKSAVQLTEQNIDNLVSSNKINLPSNYSASNAIKQFQLMVQDKEEILSCTKSSIMKCMLDMAILGLNPSKNQCYAVAFAKKATLMTSYLGKVALAKRVDPTIQDVVARTIHVGEQFDFEDDLVTGYSRIIKHKRSLETIAVKDANKDIVGAYATIVYNDGKEPVSIVMPYSEIQKRWKMSKAKPFLADGTLKEGTPHNEFADKMCERTVISAICSPIIAKSDDRDLFGETLQAVNIESEKVAAEQEAEENMCQGDFVDVDVEYTEIDDEETSTKEEIVQENS